MSHSTLIERLRTACADAPAEIAALYVFGSVGRGEDRAGSDIDVGVLSLDASSPASHAALADLCDRLEAASRRSVDLVVLDSASPDLIHRVLRDGIVVLDRNRSRRIGFEVRARNEYFDLEPVRRSYRARGTVQRSAQ